MQDIQILALIGAFAFGVVIGWVTYGTLRRTQRSGLTDIATVIGILGGAAVTDLFDVETGAFGLYCIGLALGFFGYLLTAMYSSKAPDWLGETPGSYSRPGGGGSGTGSGGPPPIIG